MEELSFTQQLSFARPFRGNMSLCQEFASSSVLTCSCNGLEKFGRTVLIAQVFMDSELVNSWEKALRQVRR